jgi:hypothetical protein
VLIPLLIVALGITIAGSFLSFRQHRNSWPLGITVVSGAVVGGGILLSQPAVAYSALAMILITQFGDLAYQCGWLACWFITGRCSMGANAPVPTRSLSAGRACPRFQRTRPLARWRAKRRLQRRRHAPRHLNPRWRLASRAH